MREVDQVRCGDRKTEKETEDPDGESMWRIRKDDPQLYIQLHIMPEEQQTMIVKRKSMHLHVLVDRTPYR